jgi:hypothetical protein
MVHWWVLVHCGYAFVKNVQMVEHLPIYPFNIVKSLHTKKCVFRNFGKLMLGEKNGNFFICKHQNKK